MRTAPPSSDPADSFSQRIHSCRTCVLWLQMMATRDEGARQPILRETVERAELLPALVRGIDALAPVAAPPGGSDEAAFLVDSFRARCTFINLYWILCTHSINTETLADPSAADNRALWAALGTSGLPAALGHAVADACPMR